MQGVVLLIQLVQTPKKAVKDSHKTQRTNGDAQFEEPAAPDGERLGQGGGVPLYDLLPHLQLGRCQLSVSRFRGGAFRIPGILRRRLLHSQQPPYRDAEEAGEGNELVDLRQGGVALPFIDGLPGYPQPVSQGLLAESLFFSLLGDAPACGHRQDLLSGASIAKKAPAGPPTGGFHTVNPWLAKAETRWAAMGSAYSNFS